VPKKGTHDGTKDTTQATKEQEKEAETMQGTTSSVTQQEQGKTKRLMIHIGVHAKNDKVHKKMPEYTSTEDDTTLVAERVQDRVSENFKEAQHQRDHI
jgi:hypothetical protein